MKPEGGWWFMVLSLSVMCVAMLALSAACVAGGIWTPLPFAITAIVFCGYALKHSLTCPICRYGLRWREKQ